MNTVIYTCQYACVLCSCCDRRTTAEPAVDDDCTWV